MRKVSDTCPHQYLKTMSNAMHHLSIRHDHPHRDHPIPCTICWFKCLVTKPTGRLLLFIAHMITTLHASTTQEQQFHCSIPDRVSLLVFSLSFSDSARSCHHILLLLHHFLQDIGQDMSRADPNHRHFQMWLLGSELHF